MLVVEGLARLVEAAAPYRVEQIALTEHFFRFRQAEWLLSRWWEATDDPPQLKTSMERYWYEHVGHDLDKYVETCLRARQEGLPVLVGLELDYYPGAMEKVADLIGAYPFDVVLGSVHWLECWRFDDIGDALSMQRWEEVDTEAAFRRYFAAVAEMAATGACDVLAHPDLIKVTGRTLDKGLVREMFAAVIEAALSMGLAIEVNTAGKRKPIGQVYPSPDLLEMVRDAGLPVTLASDAHNVSQLGHGFAETTALLKRTGIKELALYRGRRRIGSLTL
jgi:histidinol-phosphatase (PHP family)